MKQVFVFISLIVSGVCYSQKNTGLKLWYNQPSGTIWENALPICNGRLGAMVYGNVETETIQLNEHTLWSGSPNRNDNPLILDSLSEIRKLIFDGKQKEAESMANRIIISKGSHGQMFEPAGELHLSFTGHENFTNYYRELDIEKAVTKASYKVADISYTREILASFPDRVIVIHLTASKSHSISFTAFYSTPLPNVVIKTTGSGQLAFSGTTIDHEGIKEMIRYKGIVKIKTQNGSLSSTDTSIVVKNANEATIYISIATTFKNYHDVSGNENERAASYLNKATPKSFASILKGHVTAYQKYFNRVKLDLGTTEAADLPTN